LDVANLTIESVERIQPTAKRREIPDGACPCLYLVVQPSGAKSWAVRYRHAGKMSKLTLGRYPRIPLAEPASARKARLAVDPNSDPPDARSLARAALQAVATGRNPAVERKAARGTAKADAHLVRSVWAEYVERHLCRKAKASSAARFKAIFEKHILPKWRDRPVAEIRKADVLAVTDEAQKRGQSARNSTITVLSSFFNWCMGRDLVEHSPVDRVKKTKEKSRDRFLSDFEIKTFWNGCDGLGSVFGPMFQMLLLTGARRSEVANMTHAELNLKSRLWTIPGARTKNGKPHEIYLSDAALAILKSLPRFAGSRFAFSTTGGSASSGFHKAKTRLNRMTGGLAPYTLHDLRRSFASGMARIGISIEIIERCLNHSLGGVAAVYNRHDYAAQMADAFATWGNHVAELVRDEEHEHDAAAWNRHRQRFAPR
jgi:integrase